MWSEEIESKPYIRKWLENASYGTTSYHSPSSDLLVARVRDV
jgi:hypothetical protein